MENCDFLLMSVISSVSMATKLVSLTSRDIAPDDCGQTPKRISSHLGLYGTSKLSHPLCIKNGSHENTFYTGK